MPNDRVLILYDNRSDRSDLQPGWGFSALIEFGGHRVLASLSTMSQRSVSTSLRSTPLSCPMSTATI